MDSRKMSTVLHEVLDKTRVRTLNSFAKLLQGMTLEINSGAYSSWSMNAFNLRVMFMSLMTSLQTLVTIAADVDTAFQLYDQKLRDNDFKEEALRNKAFIEKVQTTYFNETEEQSCDALLSIESVKKAIQDLALSYSTGGLNGEARKKSLRLALQELSMFNIAPQGNVAEDCLMQEVATRKEDHYRDNEHETHGEWLLNELVLDNEPTVDIDTLHSRLFTNP